MLHENALHLVVVSDLGQPLAWLLARLTPAEREQAEEDGLSERRRRHFVLGRLAAHLAIQQVLGDETRLVYVEVTKGFEGAPLVHVDGVVGGVSVSLSHSWRLVAACAWTDRPWGQWSAGVDLERIRPTEVGRSEYAFLAEERRLLARLPEGLELAGLAAWTVKEAAWKALRPSQDTGPAEIEIRALNLARGYARVRVGSRLRALATAVAGDYKLKVKVGAVRGPDDVYMLSLAKIMPQSGRGGSESELRSALSD